MILKHYRLTGFALALVIGVLLAPAALAQPSDQVGPTSLPASSPSPSATARPEVLPNPDNQQPTGASSATYTPTTSQVRAMPIAPGPGFDWGDAGIGAGAAFALTMIGLGGVLVLNNRHHRAEQPAPTA